MKKESIRKYLYSVPFDESRFGDRDGQKREGKDFHIRFAMSGYGISPSATEINMNILFLFAKFGIFDYTNYLFLDFHKGRATLYFAYWNDTVNHEVDLTGLTTCEIVEQVFKHTVYSDRPQRRRF